MTAITEYWDLIESLPEREQVQIVALVYAGTPVRDAIRTVINEGYGI